MNKPAGLSSAQTVARVKRLVGADKCGHTGTLDPFATGVLICCVNQATRLARFFLHSQKKYDAVLRLGIETDTQDVTGQVVARQRVPEISAAELASVFKHFEGTSLQQPPVYAALKHEGRPLYKLARQGKPVKKPPRAVTIGQLCIADIRLPYVHFKVSCSAGTYIRTLCADIGQKLGCGAHLIELRRTASGDFTIEQAVDLDVLQEMAAQGRALGAMIPMAEALGRMPTLIADTQALEVIRHGRPLTSDWIRAGIGEYKDPAGINGFLKVVDVHQELKAVIQKAGNGMRYNYCCVFH